MKDRKSSIHARRGIITKHETVRTGILISLLMLFFFTVSACPGGKSGGAGKNSIPTSISIGNGKLSWAAPATYTDGSPLTVAGYKVYYGAASGVYDGVIDINAQLPNGDVSSLPTGTSATFYFAVTAYDAPGIESDYSNEVSKFLIIP